MSDQPSPAEWMGAVGAITAAYDVLGEVLTGAGVSADRAGGFAEAIVALLAKHDPPILLGFPDEFKDGANEITVPRPTPDEDGFYLADGWRASVSDGSPGSVVLQHTTRAFWRIVHRSEARALGVALLAAADDAEPAGEVPA